MLFAMLGFDLQSITERINTGTENPDTSRALVVFNLTPQLLSGTAVFRASMSWPRDFPLPPITVTDSAGVPVPSVIQDKTQGPDTQGRADRVQLSFAIYFCVTGVPANGWRTYLASYADAPSPPRKDFVETPGLTVVETTRHAGDLAMAGVLKALTV